MVIVEGKENSSSSTQNQALPLLSLNPPLKLNDQSHSEKLVHTETRNTLSQINETQIYDEFIFDDEFDVSDAPSDLSLSSLSSVETEYALDSPKPRKYRKRSLYRKIIIFKFSPELELQRKVDMIKSDLLQELDQFEYSDNHACLNKKYLSSGLYSKNYLQTSQDGIKPQKFHGDRQKLLPLPENYGWWHLNNQKDFQLPFDIAYQFENKLLKFDDKPPAWIKIKRNIYLEREKRRIPPHPCACEIPEDGSMGCLENCINRATFIECGKNCKLGDKCSNQNFKSKKFVDGLKVASSGDKRGFGLVTSTDINSNTLIQEYLGEIISNVECQRRMAEDYKDAKCFYFLDYSNGEVIDGTVKGSEVRFVNHSCDPNCHIEKWFVDGEVAIGLFSSRFIPAGSELTYDYNFHHFGQNKQVCLCGADKCRGWMGKSNEVKEEIQAQFKLEQNMKQLQQGGRKKNSKIKNIIDIKKVYQNNRRIKLVKKLRQQSPDITAAELDHTKVTKVLLSRNISRTVKFNQRPPVRKKRNKRFSKFVQNSRVNLNLSLMKLEYFRSQSRKLILIRNVKAVLQSLKVQREGKFPKILQNYDAFLSAVNLNVVPNLQRSRSLQDLFKL